MHTVTAGSVLRGMLTGGPYYHLYFLYLIAGLYVVTPILRVYLSAASSDDKSYFITASFLFVFLQQGFNFFAWTDGAPFFAMTLFISFVGYYVGGAYLSKVPVRKKHLGFIILIMFSCMLITFLGFWLLVGRYGLSARGYYLRNYLSSPEVPICFCIFLLAKYYYHQKNDRDGITRSSFMARLAPMSFGVYLIHPLVMDLLNRIALNGLWITAPVGIPFTTMVTLIVSFFAVGIIRKIPVLSHVV